MSEINTIGFEVENYNEVDRGTTDYEFSFQDMRWHTDGNHIIEMPSEITKSPAEAVDLFCKIVGKYKSHNNFLLHSRPEAILSKDGSDLLTKFSSIGLHTHITLKKNTASEILKFMKNMEMLCIFFNPLFCNSPVRFPDITTRGNPELRFLSNRKLTTSFCLLSSFDDILKKESRSYKNGRGGVSYNTEYNTVEIRNIDFPSGPEQYSFIMNLMELAANIKDPKDLHEIIKTGMVNIIRKKPYMVDYLKIVGDSCKMDRSHLNFLRFEFQEILDNIQTCFCKNVRFWFKDKLYDFRKYVIINAEDLKHKMDYYFDSRDVYHYNSFLIKRFGTSNKEYLSKGKYGGTPLHSDMLACLFDA